MLTRSLKFFLFSLMLVAALMMFGCGSDGSDGAPGPAGPPGPPGEASPGIDNPAAVEPETCAICHANVDQEKHQSIYNEYTDASTLAVTIDNVTSTNNGDGTFDATLTFTVTENGVPYTGGAASLAQKAFYAATYDDTTAKFPLNASFSASTIAATGTPGQFTVDATGASIDPANLTNGQLYGYVAKDPLMTEDLGESSHVTLYNDVASVATAVGNVANYASPANVTGCEKCHGTPYLKHGYRAAQVTNLSDFSACKACHYDTRTGGHADWQVLVTDPDRFADRFLWSKDNPTLDVDDPAENVTNPELILTPAEETQYAYTANIMNDVHMSHSMEFGYPQSMSNCATCHDGKLDIIQADENFTAETCKSCHAVTTTVDEAAGEENPINSHAAPSLQKLWDDAQVSGFHNDTLNCVGCHVAGGGFGAKLFSELMPGYDPKIYTAANDGTRYSDIFTVTIDDVVFADNVLTIGFTAHETDGQTTGFSAADIVPTLEVGLYAYSTKDFLVGPHRRDVDNDRNLEVTFGDTNPRVTIESAGAGSWTATADVSAWADKIADGKIKRAEIAVLPALRDEALGIEPRSGEPYSHALNAPSRTFDLTTNAFDDTYFDNIVDVRGDIAGDVSGSCNSCHDALATTFHDANRGGNIRVCRLCHDSLDQGSHLELQSRAIDSYVHAIHTFQAFDIGDINFADPVEAVAYDVHIEHFFPRFTRKACEACHVEKGSGNAKYRVPDQAKSLSALLSGSDTVEGRSLDIASYVTGPAYRSCGGCHRAEELNEEEFGELVSLNGHAKQNGYLVDAGDDPDSVLETVIETIQAFFN